MRRRTFDSPSQAHFLTWSIYRRQPLFQDPQLCRLFLEKLNEARTKLGLEVWAYVLMPDHVHLLIWSDDSGFRTSDALRLIKQPFARAVLDSFRRQGDDRLQGFTHISVNGRPCGRIWQAGGGYDRNLYSEAHTRKALDYIHANPVRANLVTVPEDYPWSSAAAYMDLPAEFSIDRWRDFGVSGG